MDTSNVLFIFSKQVYKKYLIVLIELWPNPDLVCLKPGLSWLTLNYICLNVAQINSLQPLTLKKM